MSEDVELQELEKLVDKFTTGHMPHLSPVDVLNLIIKSAEEDYFKRLDEDIKDMALDILEGDGTDEEYTGLLDNTALEDLKRK